MDSSYAGSGARQARSIVPEKRNCQKNRPNIGSDVRWLAFKEPLADARTYLLA